MLGDPPIAYQAGSISSVHHIAAEYGILGDTVPSWEELPELPHETDKNNILVGPWPYKMYANCWEAQEPMKICRKTFLGRKTLLEDSKCSSCSTSAWKKSLSKLHVFAQWNRICCISFSWMMQGPTAARRGKSWAHCSSASPSHSKHHHLHKACLFLQLH